MSKIIAKKVITRKAGYLYYLDKQGNVHETKMNRKGGKKGRTVCKVSKKKTSRKKATSKKSGKKRK